MKIGRVGMLERKVPEGVGVGKREDEGEGRKWPKCIIHM